MPICTNHGQALAGGASIVTAIVALGSPPGMRSAPGRAGRGLVVAFLPAASVAFGVGIAIEKAEEGEAGHAEERLLGIELESTPLVLAGLVTSLVLALALWRYGQRGWPLGLAAIFCLGFAVLDGIEASRTWGRRGHPSPRSPSRRWCSMPQRRPRPVCWCAAPVPVTGSAAPQLGPDHLGTGCWSEAQRGEASRHDLNRARASSARLARAD